MLVCKTKKLNQPFNKLQHMCKRYEIHTRQLPKSRPKDLEESWRKVNHQVEKILSKTDSQRGIKNHGIQKAQGRLRVEKIKGKDFRI